VLVPTPEESAKTAEKRAVEAEETIQTTQEKLEA
jgi:hypothetical protein